MKYKPVILAVLAILLAIGLLVLLNVDWSKPSAPIETPRSMAGPYTDAEAALTDREFAAKLEQIRLQLGPEFRVQIVKPFVVASNLSAANFDRICQQTIGWAVRILNKDFFSTPVRQIVTIYLFRDKESYEQHSWSLFSQRPTTPYGYYLPQHQVLLMNIATGTGTLVHEIVHPLLAADFPQAPSWFDEGLASLYEQCRERDGKIVGLLNWRLPVLQDGLRAGHFVPLEKLLTTSRDEFYEDPHGMHYAQARYLCYYLQEKHLLQKFYHEFKTHYASDPTGTATLLRITGKDSLKQLQSEWQDFLSPLRHGR